MFWRSGEEMKCQKVLQWKNQWRGEEWKSEMMPHAHNHIWTGQLTPKESSRIHTSIFNVSCTFLIFHFCAILCPIFLLFLPWNLSIIAHIGKKVLYFPSSHTIDQSSASLTPLCSHHLLSHSEVTAQRSDGTVHCLAHLSLGQQGSNWNRFSTCLPACSIEPADECRPLGWRPWNLLSFKYFKVWWNCTSFPYTLVFSHSFTICFFGS